MQPISRWIVAAVLLAGLSLGPRQAEAEDVPETTLLLRAVKASSLGMLEAMSSGQRGDTRVVEATFLLDRQGQLLLRCTMRVTKHDDETESFESWIGRVHGAGWVPRTRALEGKEAAQAEALWSRFAHTDVLRLALMGAKKTKDRPAPADVVLSVSPGVRSKEGKATVDLQVGVGDAVKRAHFDSGVGVYKILSDGEAPARVAFEPAALPALPKDGTWFNSDAPPTFEGLRGSPVLVVITDPG